MKKIEALLNHIKTLSDIDNLSISYSSQYGGYRLVIKDKVSGGESGAFGRSSCYDRMTNKEFTQYLYGIISGLEFNKSSIAQRSLLK